MPRIMDGEQLRQIFCSDFDLQQWTAFVADFFAPSELREVPESIPSPEGMDTGYYLGALMTEDSYRIGLFVYTVAEGSVSRRRVGLRQWVKRFINPLWGEFDAALVVYKDKDSSDWRLSFVCDIKGEKTDPKRYTYLFGPVQGRLNTPVSRFLQLQKAGVTFAAIREAFSVEALTKDFYNELFQWFLWAIAEETGVTYPNNPNVPEDDREKIEQKIIRLIARLLFVWFIRQRHLVPDSLFDEHTLRGILRDFNPQAMDSGCYYNAILQNLFFATLNSEVSARAFATRPNRRDIKTLYRYAELFSIGEAEVLQLFGSIPFLNGGLFECLDKVNEFDDEAYAYDGFSRNGATFADGRYKHRAFVPNALFFDANRGLFSILNRYNFTIEENSVADQQVALDPELLGQVFENLLAYTNEETQESARKSSGSFYTPRPIVEYMVEESLVARLGDTEEVRQVFAPDFEYDPTKHAFYAELKERLLALKILDPACGSGAFPMSILAHMLEVLQRIDPMIDSYETKLRLIENNIYGVDIQPIAIQISKLRLFISIICDLSDRDDSQPNFGIPTLPNLESKFVAADALLQPNPGERDLFAMDLEEAKELLIDVRRQHFEARTASEKKRLRDRDKQLRERLIVLLKEMPGYSEEEIELLAHWDPYDQNDSSRYFSPEWMLGVTAFDIVIGNPPYIQLQKKGGLLAKRYELSKADKKKGRTGFKSFAAQGDIYCLFYERGLELLALEGILCYITSNKWMRAGYGEALRQLIMEQSAPLILIDFAGVKVFESATVDTNILLTAKQKIVDSQTLALTFPKDATGSDLHNLRDFVWQHAAPMTFPSDGSSYIILSPIELSIRRKIEAVGKPLKEWDVKIYRGVLTGCNEAFIITTEERDELLSQCQSEEERKRTAELIRPILRGRDIKRYSYDWAGLWIIATFPSLHYDIEDYPAVRDYLLHFGKERLEQTGKTYTIDGETFKSRKKTANKWFEVQDSIAYWKDFDRPKIIWKIIGSRLAFTIDTNRVMVNNACYILTGERLTHILGFLNSSPLIWYSEITNMNKTGVGDAQVGAQNIMLFPVPAIVSEEIERYVNLLLNDPVNEEMKLRLAKLIYAVFDLSEDEISFLEALNL